MTGVLLLPKRIVPICPFMYVIHILGGNTVAFLSIQQVVKDFGSSRALDDISFEVEKGEFVCLLGPSGCGKTTLLRIIAGLEHQSSGTLIQDGVDISSLPVKARDFGIVFQSYALFPNQTVAQNIAYGLKSQKFPKDQIKARVNSLIETMGLEEHVNKYPDQLSGGQQQRVALARALALNPGLLLLDEPLSALDAKVRQRLRSEIKRVQQELGVTTIMVTHDQDEALSMADKIVVMNKGTIEQVGSPAEIYAAPQSRFVGEFVGAMNFLPASGSPQGVLSNECLGIAFRIDTEQTEQGEHLGEGLSLAIRPEHIKLGVQQKEGQEVLQARIVALEFFGRFSRLALALEGADHLLHADIALDELSQRELALGQSVELCIPNSAIQVFKSCGQLLATKPEQVRS